MRSRYERGRRTVAVATGDQDLAEGRAGLGGFSGAHATATTRFDDEVQVLLGGIVEILATNEETVGLVAHALRLREGGADGELAARGLVRVVVDRRRP